MNSNQVMNPKIEVPKGTNLNDKDYMNYLLSTLKEMVKNYSVTLTEASCEPLYHKFKEMFLEYAALQREVYELMFKKGWYVLERAEQTKIDSKYQTLNQEFMDLQG